MFPYFFDLGYERGDTTPAGSLTNPHGPKQKVHTVDVDSSVHRLRQIEKGETTKEVLYTNVLKVVEMHPYDVDVSILT